MWALILTLWNFSSGGVHIYHIDGFESEPLCQKAADDFLRANIVPRNYLSGPANIKGTAVCAKKI